MPGFLRSALLAVLAAAAQAAAAASQLPLELEKKIPLGRISGRIDHFAFDAEGGRLFLAELGNDTVSVMDLSSGAVIRRLDGLRQPQGVGYVPELKSLFIANAGDGSVRAFRGDNLVPAGKLDLKDDADNVRVMPGTHDVIVGFGSGALAVIDGGTLRKKAEIPLKGHPEGFQIDPAGKRLYANVPDAHEVAVVDLERAAQVASWDKLPARANFPMALVAGGQRIAVAFRSPARLAVFDAASGAVTAQLPTCGDADDVFWDARRDRLYVSCGEGKIDVFEGAGSGPKWVAQVTAAPGARTAYFDAVGDRYYLAVRAGLTAPAEIWVYRPR